jgi:ribosomal protein S18 acetylase RimI-like enzyme
MKKFDINIRDYKADDYAEIEQMWENLDLASKVRADNANVISKTLEQGGKFLVMELRETKEIIGTSWISNDGRRLYLHHFGIKLEYQGNGLSKILLEKTLMYAKEMKMQIKLEVHKSNYRAKKLYEKYSFQYLGDYLVYIIRDTSNLEF